MISLIVLSRALKDQNPILEMQANLSLQLSQTFQTLILSRSRTLMQELMTETRLRRMH